MIRAGRLLGVLASVAACSGQQDVASDGGANAAGGGASAVEGTAARGASSESDARTPGAGAGLTAQVSALTGQVSGLNVRVTDLGTVIDLPSDALFEFDKAELTPTATAELGKAAELIRRGAPGPIQVIGHTDSKGDDAYNQKLSEARARSVADWFGQQVGVRQRRFDVSGKGETAPIAPNQTANGKDDPAGRARNRRVEIVIPNNGASPAS